MKSTNKKIFTAIVSVALSIVVITSCLLPVYAATNIADIIAGLTGNGSGDQMNLSQSFSQWLNDLIQEDEESAIDKFVDGLKNIWTGEDSDESGDNVEEDAEDVIVLDKGATENVATLFNLTVNELKNGSPAFRKTVVATMDSTLAQSLQGGLGPVTGIVESLIGTKDLFAGVIEGTSGSNQVITNYPFGNDVINNIPLAGKEYVSAITGDDIKDYTISANIKSGAYRIHIDLKDVEGSPANSGLARVFDVTDKAYATIELGTYSINVNVMLKYVNNYVECQVNRDGELIGYTTHMGITFLFQQTDGSYSSKMPYFDVDFEEKGIIYDVTTEYSAIDYTVRKMGDADDNGKINSSDARLVLRAAALLEPLADDATPFCDVTGDGLIKSADARDILRAAAELIQLPTTESMLGYKEYHQDEATQTHINDILAILVAYQSAKDAQAESELKDYYDKLYGDGNGAESTTKQEETTTGEINTPSNNVEDIIDGIGNIIGNNNGNSDNTLGNIIGGLGNLLGQK